MKNMHFHFSAGVAFRGLPDVKLYPSVSAVYGNTEVSMVYLGQPLDGWHHTAGEQNCKVINHRKRLRIRVLEQQDPFIVWKVIGGGGECAHTDNICNYYD